MNKRALSCLLSGLAFVFSPSNGAEPAEAAKVAKEERALAEKEANAILGENAALEKRARTLDAVADRVEGKTSGPAAVSSVRLLSRFEQEPLVLAKGEPGDGGLFKEWLKELTPGKKYRFRAEIRAKGVEGLKNLKFGLMVPTAGKTQWPCAKVGIGTFDWRGVSFDVAIPFDSGACLLLIGLEGKESVGEMAIRNLTVDRIE